MLRHLHLYPYNVFVGRVIIIIDYLSQPIVGLGLFWLLFSYLLVTPFNILGTKSN